MRLGSRVRSTEDGQLGFITEGAEGNGGLWVRLDRRGETRLLPYEPTKWVKEEEPRLAEIAIARICYEADRGYRLAAGSYSLPSWIEMREEDRIAWIKGPPKDADGKRVKLFEGLRKLVKSL